MKHLRSCKLLALGLAVWLAACTSWRVSTSPGPTSPAVLRKVGDAALLQVDDTALDWGAGRLGDIVRDTLRASGTFAEVYYPVEPPNAPSIRLRIEAFGSEQEHPGLITIGIWLFIPVLVIPILLGVLPMRKTFRVDANVLLMNADREIRRFSTSASATVSYSMFFSAKHDFEAAAADAAFRQLAEQVAAAL